MPSSSTPRVNHSDRPPNTRGLRWQNWFVNNTCVANSDSGGFRSDCKKGDMEISGNAIYNRKGALGKGTICDKSNTVAVTPSNADVIEMGKKVLATK